jgi:phosphate/sulfate permease
LAGSSVFLATLNFDLPSHGSESVGDFFGIVSGSGLASNVDYLSITSVSSVPEPAVLLLLLTMGLGVWLFGRKVLSKSTP